MSGTGWPPRHFPLVQDGGCGRAERWLQSKAEKYSDEAAKKLPEVRDSLLRLFDEGKEMHRDVRLILSDKLVPVYLFSSFKPGGVTKPLDVKRAVIADVVETAITTQSTLTRPRAPSVA